MPLSEIVQWITIGSVFAGLVAGAVRIEMRVNRLDEKVALAEKRLNDHSTTFIEIRASLSKLEAAVARIEGKLDRNGG